MSRLVHKFEVRPMYTEVPLPKGAVIRHVGVQDYKIQVWVEFDFENRNTFEPRYIHCIMTGEPFDPGETWKFLGTVQGVTKYKLVFHMYEAQ